MEDGSPFLRPGPRTTPNTLAIAALSRDNLQPVILEQSEGAVDGYAEGATLNTRFGSYPHSTLLDIPWGSQVRASAVDTGSRGRKRKRAAAAPESESGPTDENSHGAPASAPAKKAVVAPSGFLHILRPTPELWTSSLPHRTQVVYTPDYSYILHRLRARPGTRLIEAGAGSGSFTHASARAVYSGYPSGPEDKRGRVFSFEFHKPRYEKMRQEARDHKLDGVVHLTHRDVYADGFLVDGESPQASAVFLDLPAPWRALRHLSRRKHQPVVGSSSQAANPGAQETCAALPSPLDPKQTIHICTFSPCIEQVTRTVEELRSEGWTDIEMVEIANKRYNVTTERLGMGGPIERAGVPAPADVAEALVRLRQVNYKTLAFSRTQSKNTLIDSSGPDMEVDTQTASDNSVSGRDMQMKPDQEVEDVSWNRGRIVHRVEGEIKTHTSYLVFAVLPRQWTQADEDEVMARWPCGNERRTIGNLEKEARKQEKRETMFTKKQKRKYDSLHLGSMAQHSPPSP